MELRHLQYFVAVAEALSFTRAAGNLHLAQPSLTCQIKNLENELGVQLILREKRQIALTAHGSFFLKRTKQLLAQSATNVSDLRQLAGISGRVSLNIGYAADLHYDLLPGALNGLRKIWPDAVLHPFDLTAAQQIRAFDRDEIDLSFSREMKSPAKMGLRCEPIHACQVMAVLPLAHSQACSRLVDLKELRSTPFIVLSEKLYPGTRAWLKRICEHAGFAPKIAHTVDRVPTLLSFVGLGLGAALLPEACRKLPHEGVIFSPLAEPITSRTDLLWKRSNLSEPLQRYIHLVRAGASGDSSHNSDRLEPDVAEF